MNYTSFNDKINEMMSEDEFNFTYKGKEYTLKCYSVHERFGKSLSVSNRVWSSMNVDKITKQYINLYDYNMMGQRTNYKMAIDEIEIVKKEIQDMPGFEGTKEALDNLSIFK